MKLIRILRKVFCFFFPAKPLPSIQPKESFEKKMRRLGYDQGPMYWSKGFVRVRKSPSGFEVWHSFNKSLVNVGPLDEDLFIALKYMERI